MWLGSPGQCCSGNVALTVASVAWCAGRNRALHESNCYFQCEEPHRNCSPLHRAQGLVFASSSLKSIKA